MGKRSDEKSRSVSAAPQGAARALLDILAPFFEVEFRGEVRERAVFVLARVWPAEPEVWAVFTVLAPDTLEDAVVRGAAEGCIQDVVL